MSHAIASSLPAEIVAGTQVDLRRIFSDYKPSVGWTAKLFLAGGDPAAPVLFSKSYSAVGEGYDLTLTATETATLTRGVYRWEDRATLGTEVVRADWGSVRVAGNIATGAALSVNATRLAAVRAAINLRLGAGGSANGIIESYGIHGRNVVYEKLSVLFMLESRLALAVEREGNPGGWGPTVEVHFTPASGGRLRGPYDLR